MQIPAAIKKEFTFDPGFHLASLRQIEAYLNDILEKHPSPNQKNGPGMHGDFSSDIAESYSSFLSLRDMISDAANECNNAVCECDPDCHL